MRHLMSIIEANKSPLKKPDGALERFGSRYHLTDTEIIILSALIQGHSLREIAVETGRGYGTVRWHVQNILDKCQVSSQKTLLSEFYSLIEG